MDEGVDVEVAEGDLGTSRVAMKGREWVGKHNVRVGKEVIK